MSRQNRRVIRNFAKDENRFKDNINLIIDDKIEKCYNILEVEVISNRNLGGYANEK